MIVQTEAAEISSSEKQAPKELAKEELASVLEQHQKWIESDGTLGTRADLTHASLEGSDLAQVILEGAFLRQTNLRDADLSLANLRAAYLIQADLSEANLFGTQLRGANLQGAYLESAFGLSARQLGDTNLFGAVLPRQIGEFGELKIVHRLSRNAQRLLAAVLMASVFTWWLIFSTTDIQLLKNAAALPLPLLRDHLPTVGFYLVVPLLLFALYVCLHFHLQRLWESLAELPAIFPDGRTLDKIEPGLLTTLARTQFKWLGETRLSASILEVGIPLFLVYWIVPATLLFFWGRYLTAQDLRGTMLHIALVVSAVAFALFLPNLMARTLRGEDPQPQRLKKAPRSATTYMRVGIPAGIGVFLFLLSLGITYGVPHDNARPGERAAGVRKWAPNALWLIGYNPYADLTELEVSSKPVNWTDRDEDIALVKGVRLSKSSVRHAAAHRAFLVNARLWQTDLRGADLSEADLRGANLRQANLQFALLDRARLARANLQTASLQHCDLTRADLREADLSYAHLSDAILIEAKLESARLYAAEIHAGSLLRANLEKADLREADLQNTKLAFANLREAELWSAKLPGADLQGAQLQRAILIEADLRKANFRGADLQGAVLRGADLAGANLQDADLRDAKGLSADQICSVAERHAAQLDEVLQQQVDTQCGTIRR